MTDPEEARDKRADRAIAEEHRLANAEPATQPADTPAHHAVGHPEPARAHLFTVWPGRDTERTDIDALVAALEGDGFEVVKRSLAGQDYLTVEHEEPRPIADGGLAVDRDRVVVTRSLHQSSSGVYHLPAVQADPDADSPAAKCSTRMPTTRWLPAEQAARAGLRLCQHCDPGADPSVNEGHQTGHDIHRAAREFDPDDDPEIVTDGGKPRLTIRAPQPLVDALDQVAEHGAYPTRSAVVRDALRRFTDAHPAADTAGVDLSMTDQRGAHVPDIESEVRTDGGGITCPACGADSAVVYRCSNCGKDLVDEPVDDTTATPWGVTDD